MPGDLSNAEFRLRLQRISEALRQFGLVDRFGVASLFRRPELPTKSALVKLLRPHGGRFPANVKPDFVAGAILSAVRVPDPDVSAWREAHESLRCDLNTIKAGKRHATRYHRHIFDLLSGVFEGVLDNPRLERPIRAGLKKIDIMFDNNASRGFFRYVWSRRHIPCDYVPFECKNYSDDPGNPEYDQLAGRLNERRGCLGFLVCRTITNRARSLEHLRDRRDDGKWIIALEDSDVEPIYSARWRGDLGYVDLLLREKFKELIM